MSLLLKGVTIGTIISYNLKFISCINLIFVSVQIPYAIIEYIHANHGHGSQPFPVVILAGDVVELAVDSQLLDFRVGFDICLDVGRMLVDQIVER